MSYDLEASYGKQSVPVFKIRKVSHQPRHRCKHSRVPGCVRACPILDYSSSPQRACRRPAAGSRPAAGGLQAGRPCADRWLRAPRGSVAWSWSKRFNLKWKRGTHNNCVPLPTPPHGARVCGLLSTTFTNISLALAEWQTSQHCGHGDPDHARRYARRPRRRGPARCLPVPSSSVLSTNMFYHNKMI